MNSLAMIFHIVTGMLAVIAGVLALSVTKGAGVHRKSGWVFFYTMLLMALSGGLLAYLKPMMITVIAAAFTCYLVYSALMVVRFPANTLTVFDYLAPVIALFIGGTGLYFGWLADASDDGLKDGFSSGPYYFFGGLAIVCSVLDLRVLGKNGLSGNQRLARHLWRMCFGLFIALGSLFSQGVKSFPESVRNSELLTIPENLILLVMFCWLVKLQLYPQVKQRYLIAKEKHSGDKSFRE